MSNFNDVLNDTMNKNHPQYNINEAINKYTLDNVFHQMKKNSFTHSHFLQNAYDSLMASVYASKVIAAEITTKLPLEEQIELVESSSNIKNTKECYTNEEVIANHSKIKNSYQKMQQIHNNMEIIRKMANGSDDISPKKPKYFITQ